MNIKANANGTYTLVHDGTSGITVNDVKCTSGTIGTYDSYCSSVSTVSSVLEEITKKPEVRVEQRSALEVNKRVASEKNRKKLQKHWAKKRAAERENRIQEMAEAIVRAKELSKKSKKQFKGETEE